MMENAMMTAPEPGFRLVNAQVLAPEVTGATELAFRDGLIADSAGADAQTIDCEGDMLIPGLIDLHTDNIEHHFHPRPGVTWPSGLAAAVAHDAQMLAAGITTVLDSLSLGDYDSAGARTKMLHAAIGGIDAARAANILRADHWFHFRCELSDGGLLPIIETHVDNPRLRLMSMMDHTPGQRQWHDVGLYREFRRKKNNRVWSDAEWQDYLDDRMEQQARFVPEARAIIAAHCRDKQIRLASHDDTTIADVEQSADDGITISEFPTTLLAARHARERGQHIVMGSPNVVLGGSHSGNVGAMQLAEADCLDVLTSDYVPASLLHGAFLVGQRLGDLSAGVRTVTSRPAELLGFADRGRLEAGLRADIVQVRMVGDVPVVRGVWVAGRRTL
jgi:alpha-D-ribose 1-methylphosphonate 5-triphosphate diphosphatase